MKHISYKDFKQIHSKGQHDWWDDLNEEEKKDLLSGLKEVKHPHNLVSHKETISKARKCLEK